MSLNQRMKENNFRIPNVLTEPTETLKHRNQRKFVLHLLTAATVDEPTHFRNACIPFYFQFYGSFFFIHGADLVLLLVLLACANVRIT